MRGPKSIRIQQSSWVERMAATSKQTTWLDQYRDNSTGQNSRKTGHKISENLTLESPTVEQLLSPEQAADRLSVSRKFIYEQIAKGEIEALRVGRLRRIRQSDLQAWLLRQQRS